LLIWSCSRLRWRLLGCIKKLNIPELLHKIHNYPADSTSEAQTPPCLLRMKIQPRQAFNFVIRSHRKVIILSINWFWLKEQMSSDAQHPITQSVLVLLTPVLCMQTHIQGSQPPY
jgi:hypothetical protein